VTKTSHSVGAVVTANTGKANAYATKLNTQNSWATPEVNIQLATYVTGK
jgi:hypothetical protein